MNNRFTELFKRHKWTVEEIGTNSFIAYNDNYFVPFSCVPCGREIDMFASAVSYLIEDKEAFIASWKAYNEGCIYPTPIGYYAFSNYMNHTGHSKQFIQFGPIANHDHSTGEIEGWLRKFDEK